MKFKDIKLMCVAEMKKEASSILKSYPNNKNIPSDLYIRLNLLITEMKKQEAFELSEKEKSEKGEYEEKLARQRIIAFRQRFNISELNKPKNN